MIKKQIYLNLSFTKHKNNDFTWFTGFHFQPYTQKRRLQNQGNSPKTPQYCNISMYLQKQLNYCSNHIKTPKTIILGNFRVSVFSFMPKNENSETTKILQKRLNTVMLECSLKNSCNTVQITSKSKWFSQLTNHRGSICLPRTLGQSEPKRMDVFLAEWICCK